MVVVVQGHPVVVVVVVLVGGDLRVMRISRGTGARTGPGTTAWRPAA